MNDLSNITARTSTDSMPITAAVESEPSKRDSGHAVAVDRGDRAEISELGELLSVASELPDVRAQKVAEVRLALEQDAEGFIAARLAGTVERIVDDLLGG